MTPVRVCDAVALVAAFVLEGIFWLVCSLSVSLCYWDITLAPLPNICGVRVSVLHVCSYTRNNAHNIPFYLIESLFCRFSCGVA